MFVAAAHLRVPFFAVVLRKGYGLGAMAMAGRRLPRARCSRSPGRPASSARMGLEGAVRLGYRKELEARRPKARERDALFQQLVARQYENGQAHQHGGHAGDRRGDRSGANAQLAGAGPGIHDPQAAGGRNVRRHLVGHRSMKTVRMPSGDIVPALGQGTWCMGEDPSVAWPGDRQLARRAGPGAALIDTAEMYGEGRTEALVGEAIAGPARRGVPGQQGLSAQRVAQSHAQGLHRSLRRLRTDRIDLYLLHWAGSVPLAETVDAFERLQRDGQIRNWGVSNLDTADNAAAVGAARRP